MSGNNDHKADEEGENKEPLLTKDADGKGENKTKEKDPG